MDLPDNETTMASKDKNEIIKGMFKVMMESLMEGERTALLGYGKHDYRGYGTPNSRNGYYQRDLLTGLGDLKDLNIPRDRLGEFTPELLDKYQKATKPMDSLIVSLYGKGLTTRDIEDVIKNIYGCDLSPQYVSNLTKETEEERIAWQKRKLKPRYTAIFIDALFVKIRRETVSSDAVYVIAGIDDQGYRDILGIYFGAEESASYWRQILTEIKDRGCLEVLLFVADGLTGLQQVINEVYPRALTQLCVVHQIRDTLNQVRPFHREAVAADLRTIYKSKTAQDAKQKTLEVKARWLPHYPKLFNRWLDQLDNLMQFLVFPEYLHPHLYSNNWIERLNKDFRKVLKNKNSFPTENSVANLLYLKIRDITRTRENQRVNGFVQYQIDLNFLWEKYYGDRKETN